MIGYVLILLGLGDLAGVVHFITHHRTGLTAALAGAVAWAGHRVHRCYANPGRRVAPPEVQKELRAARRQARKAVTA